MTHFQAQEVTKITLRIVIDRQTLCGIKKQNFSELNQNTRDQVARSKVKFCITFLANICCSIWHTFLRIQQRNTWPSFRVNLNVKGHNGHIWRYFFIDKYIVWHYEAEFLRIEQINTWRTEQGQRSRWQVKLCISFVTGTHFIRTLRSKLSQNLTTTV